MKRRPRLGNRQGWPLSRLAYKLAGRKNWVEFGLISDSAGWSKGASDPGNWRCVRVAEKGGMTVVEAGRKGGLAGGSRGGRTTKAKYGREFYKEIGHKG